MLSRRDKLLVQPWEDRRFKDHKSKVHSALPAIDSRAPPPRAHVAVKLKKCQREAERRRRVQSDNYGLLQRLTDIMRTKRLDNCWDTPLPNFQQKVGVFYEPEPLRRRVAARAAATAHCSRGDAPGSRGAASRGGGAEGPGPGAASRAGGDLAPGERVKCFACHANRKKVLQLNDVYGARADSTPSASL